MHISMASIIVAALSLGMPAVHTQGAQPKAPPQAQSDESDQSDKSNVVRSIQIVDIKDLEPEVRSQVEAVVATTTEDDLRKLRDAIDATPEVVSALKANGLTSSHVVAIHLANGVLTIFTKTA